MRRTQLASMMAMITALVMGTSLVTTADAADDLGSSLTAIQALGKEGQGHAAAVKAWKVVGNADAKQLPQILASIDDDNPLASNWLRAAVDAIADRTLSAGNELPVASLEQFVSDRSHSARGRRLAFEWLCQVDRQARDRWIPQLLDDPSLELRRDAVAHQLQQAKLALAAESKETAIETYRTALNSARDVDQIDEATTALRELGRQVDLPRHFGFITEWQLIGPFDNTDTSGFDRAFPPEEQIDLAAQYEGKGQQVQWTQGSTDDEYGKVNLNELLGKHKGSAAYAIAFFDASEERPADIRLGCINANKVWLNGELLTANHVYHSGEGIDQYVSQGQLKKGRNTILLKICQNEQEESWAQDWEFQLRVCDALGTAILSSQP